MNYPVLIIFVVLIFGLNTAYGLPPPPPTNFVVTITDESNQPILPASLQITEILDGETLQSYGIDLFENPQTVSVGWYAPSRAENTEIHIVAVKQGYANSGEFVFTVTSQTPTEGKLFDHTFVLKTEETSKVIEKEFKVISDGKSYTLTTKSSSNVESVEFTEKESSVLMVLDEDSISGFTDLSFPTSLISSPFRTLLDNVVVFPSEEKIGKTTVLHFEYSNGLHTVRVVSQVAATTGEDFESGFETKTDKEEPESQAKGMESEQTQQPKGGGCLIATAAFGSELAPQVQFLREIRDNTVLQTESGTSFMTGFNQFYYSFSPAIADYERENPAFKEAVKLTLTPLLTSLTLLQYADIDSESEMLGYGIGVILLNIGMYFVAPAVLIMKIRKRI
jgi:hypothetical protein